MRKRVLSLILLFVAVASYAQQLRSIKIKNPVVCYASEQSSSLHVPPPEEYLRWKKNAGARQQSATIIVDYIGFPENVNGIGPKACFQAAVDIWASLISSPVVIRIEARWRTDLASNVLGSALYTSAYANFKGAQKLNVYYPVAIAEKITGTELNDGEPDLFANFNSNFTWHLDPNTPPPASPAPATHDLKTVVLHEIGHGLGFAGTFFTTATATTADWGLNDTELPISYDVPIGTGFGANLIETNDSPSADLRSHLIGNNLFFSSILDGTVKLYAPTTFSSGSSISHVDENTYNGGVNALMTPQIAAREQIQSPGIALNMLKDIGWSHVRINHAQFPGSENLSGPYQIKATIQGDQSGYIANSVKLHYTIDGINFTVVTMTATGNTDEFTASIPATAGVTEYGYFISVSDNDNREFVNPGKFVREHQSQLQNIFTFETGPDNTPPKVTHTPKGFILESDTQLKIDAKVTDNLGVESVMAEYYKNNDLVGTIPLTLTAPAEDSIYSGNVNLAAMSLVNGDQVKYRIIATDISVIGNPDGNVGYSPSSTGFHSLNVVGLSPTQGSYSNDFNSPSDDFFGNGFSIPASPPTGFTNGAIHSDHPYLEGNGFPENKRDLIYQLKIPIRVQATDAIIKFDEIALVEPGDPGSIFGQENFFDYVVVEGSKDGGVTWTPVADGYDCRAYAVWESRYKSAITGNNSTAVGDAGLYKSRTLDLQQKFDTNDEVVIRFRLFSDPFAAGWGWAIDNLKIQVDETPPSILHNHVDYLLDTDDVISLNSKVSDAGGVKAYKLEYYVNNGNVVTEVFDVDPLQPEYPFSITGLSVLNDGDVFNYRFVATDNADREGTFPAAGFIKVPIIQFPTPISSYANNFNTPSDDFTGNFFSVTQPSDFSNPAIHSNHNYDNGFGLNKTSSVSYIFKKPIKISAQNPYLRFDEIAIVEGHPTGSVFGNADFKDYVIVEGSKDEGATWHEFLDGYDNMSQNVWLAAFTSQGSGTPNMYRTRIVDLTESGDFIANDNVIIRFRMFADESINGWGWAIDNLYIQDVVTSTEKELDTAVSVYPNPTNGNITIEATGISSSVFAIQLLDTQGKITYRATEEISNGKMSHTISGGSIPAGVYFVKVSDGTRSTIKKLVKID
ncbi:MAG TPA: T9SS type A sorting domain-containing protein [Cyclobacteriaceae bacterium]|nr:T9SS type A sorting domain-containing protein [Cyclobacteriaceae bacterium]